MPFPKSRAPRISNLYEHSSADSEEILRHGSSIHVVSDGFHTISLTRFLEENGLPEALRSQADAALAAQALVRKPLRPLGGPENSVYRIADRSYRAAVAALTKARPAKQERVPDLSFPSESSAMPKPEEQRRAFERVLEGHLDGLRRLQTLALELGFEPGYVSLRARGCLEPADSASPSPRNPTPPSPALPVASRAPPVPRALEARVEKPIDLRAMRSSEVAARLGLPGIGHDRLHHVVSALNAVGIPNNGKAKSARRYDMSAPDAFERAERAARHAQLLPRRREGARLLLEDYPLDSLTASEVAELLHYTGNRGRLSVFLRDRGKAFIRHNGSTQGPQSRYRIASVGDLARLAHLAWEQGLLKDEQDPAMTPPAPSSSASRSGSAPAPPASPPAPTQKPSQAPAPQPPAPAPAPRASAALPPTRGYTYVESGAGYLVTLAAFEKKHGIPAGRREEVKTLFAAVATLDEAVPEKDGGGPGNRLYRVPAGQHAKIVAHFKAPAEEPALPPARLPERSAAPSKQEYRGSLDGFYAAHPDADRELAQLALEERGVDTTKDFVLETADLLFLRQNGVFSNGSPAAPPPRVPAPPAPDSRESRTRDSIWRGTEEDFYRDFGWFTEESFSKIAAPLVDGGSKSRPEYAFPLKTIDALRGRGVVRDDRFAPKHLIRGQYAFVGTVRHFKLAYGCARSDHDITALAARIGARFDGSRLYLGTEHVSTYRNKGFFEPASSRTP